jgi:site-specific recombinase
MRRNPRVKSNIITILAVIASVLALGQLSHANFSEEMARRLDERMVLCEK